MDEKPGIRGPVLDVDKVREVEIVVSTRLIAPHRAVLVCVYVLRAPDCFACRQLRRAGLRTRSPAPILAAARYEVGRHLAAAEFGPLRFDRRLLAMVMRPGA